MRYTIEILRRASAESEPYRQGFEFETGDESATVATALSAINDRNPIVDVDGHQTGKIMWECSCLQKKCGACAMVICGRPSLACDARLSELGDRITLEPLRKFPVIADLVVNRSVMYSNLQAMSTWLVRNAMASEEHNAELYDASRCLQCGCCLEVCPNFYSGGGFYGMASMVPVSRLLEEMEPEDRHELNKKYRRHIFEGCGKSLACRNICPAGIDIDSLMVSSNGVSLWKSLFDIRR